MIIAQQKRTFYTIIISSLVVLAAGVAFALYLKNTAAEPVQGWKAGNIMDDAVMANKSTMSASQIQSFLNSKVSKCDTNGTQLSEYGGPDLNKDGKVQRWEWGKSKYNQTKFPCLKDYTQGGKTAAQIIYSAAQKYSINPQVILVLLQKEQGLVLDTWPLNVQYKSATGYGCPDTAPCDSDYFGLTNQIDWAAKMFRAILNNSPSWYTPYVLGKNYIQYNPSASCGGSTVNIENRATQALYNYTPYQPNKGALNAGWGTASCGAYGNRNFYLYFTSWFGSTHGTVDIQGIKLENQPFTNSPTTLSFTVKNTLKSTVNLGDIGIGVRGPNNENFDLPMAKNISLEPGKSYTYRRTATFAGPEGAYKFMVIRYSGGKWLSPPFSQWGNTETGQVTDTLTKQPLITTPLSMSTQDVHKDQPVTLSYKIKNPSSRTISLPRTAVAIRDSNGKNFDLSLSPIQNLAPGAEYTYQQTAQLPASGRYTFYITSYREKYGGWNDNFPARENTAHARKISVDVRDSITITKPLKITSTSSTAPTSATATFTIKNFSAKTVEVGKLTAATRDEKNKNVDFTASPYLTLSPGEEYTYTATNTLSNHYTYKSWVASYKNSRGWSDSYPSSQQPNIARNFTTNLRKEVRLISNISIQKVGSNYESSFKIRNFATTPITVGKITLAVRNEKNQNLDFTTSPYLTLTPGQEYTYQHSAPLKAGTYSLWTTSFRDKIGWSDNFPTSERSSLIRKTSLVVP